MSKSPVTALNDYWRIAPRKLKEFVKHQTLANGYGNDPTGHMLSAHIYECKKWDISPTVCSELIRHYKKE